MRRLGCFIEVVTRQHELNRIPTVHQNAVTFLLRGALGHEDLAVNAHRPARVGHALRVVTGGCGDDAGGLLVRGKLGDVVVRTADLVRPHVLEVFTLQVHLYAILLRQPRAVLQRSRRNNAGDVRLCCLDIGCVDGCKSHNHTS